MKASGSPPCRHCGLREADHPPAGVFTPEDRAALRSGNFWAWATRVADWCRLRVDWQSAPPAGLWERARAWPPVPADTPIAPTVLVKCSGSKLPGFAEARAFLWCTLHTIGGLGLPEIAHWLCWDRSALYARQRKSASTRATWDADREREASERLRLARARASASNP